MFYLTCTVSKIHFFSFVTHSFQKFKDCLNKLNIVNDTLKKFGTPNNYKKLRMWIKWLIIGWILSIFLMNILDSLWLIGRIPTSYITKAIYLTFTVNLTLHINTLYGMLLTLLLRYVQIRLQYNETFCNTKCRSCSYYDNNKLLFLCYIFICCIFNVDTSDLNLNT